MKTETLRTHQQHDCTQICMLTLRTMALQKLLQGSALFSLEFGQSRILGLSGLSACQSWTGLFGRMLSRFFVSSKPCMLVVLDI